MLNKVKILKSYRLVGLNGEIGKVKEFYFDDQQWTIRYLVADTGTWLADRLVLISPYALRAVSKEEQRIAIGLTKQQIEDSPSVDSDKPVSRQFEESYYKYYGWPMYWGGPYIWGASPYPYMTGAFTPFIGEPEAQKVPDESAKAWDPHLRSTHHVSGYHIQAEDGEIGHVEDFIIDDKTWTIRYLVIDTRNWWPGAKVLVSPKWIDRVSWSESRVFVSLTREGIKQSPEYAEQCLLTRDYETELHRHHKRQGYWVDEPAAKGPPTGMNTPSPTL